jgi:hypothetical protein
VTSQYLLNCPRTLRQACRDICLAHQDSQAKDCHICTLTDLCVINEEIAHEERAGSARNRLLEFFKKSMMRGGKPKSFAAGTGSAGRRSTSRGGSSAAWKSPMPSGSRPLKMRTIA